MPEIALDLLHRVQLADPRYDPAADVEHSIASATLALVDALALVDGNPNRAEYIATLGELHHDDPDPYTACAITAAGWLRDQRTDTTKALR